MGPVISGTGLRDEIKRISASSGYSKMGLVLSNVVLVVIVSICGPFGPREYTLFAFVILLIHVNIYIYTYIYLFGGCLC